LPARIEEQLKKLIKRKYSVSFMSNSKWRKVFTALDPLGIKQAYWKLVDANEEIRDIFLSKDILMEKFIGDSILFCGPIAYRRIEWIEIPSKGIQPGWEHIPIMNFQQDINQVKTILMNLGHFEIEETERGIRIYGHK
jgi:hypothetical protein